MARKGQLGADNKPLGGDTTALTVTLQRHGLHRRVVEYCDRSGVTASALIRELLQRELDQVAPEDPA